MENNSVYRRASIIYTTIDLIDEIGIQAVSTREIARRQGISQGTVFQYFPKKSDILKSVLEHYSIFDQDIDTTIKADKKPPKEALYFIWDTYTAYYENYPQITSMMQAYDVLKNDPELGEGVKDIFFKRMELIQKLIEAGQAAGTIRNDISSNLLTDIITSTVRGICQKWRMSGYSFSLREQTKQAMDVLIGAFA